MKKWWVVIILAILSQNFVGIMPSTTVPAETLATPIKSAPENRPWKSYGDVMVDLDINPNITETDKIETPEKLDEQVKDKIKELTEREFEENSPDDLQLRKMEDYQWFRAREKLASSDLKSVTFDTSKYRAGTRSIPKKIDIVDMARYLGFKPEELDGKNKDTFFDELKRRYDAEIENHKKALTESDPRDIKAEAVQLSRMFAVLSQFAPDKLSKDEKNQKSLDPFTGEAIAQDKAKEYKKKAFDAFADLKAVENEVAQLDRRVTLRNVAGEDDVARYAQLQRKALLARFDEVQTRRNVDEVKSEFEKEERSRMTKWLHKIHYYGTAKPLRNSVYNYFHTGVLNKQFLNSDILLKNRRNSLANLVKDSKTGKVRGVWANIKTILSVGNADKIDARREGEIAKKIKSIAQLREGQALQAEAWIKATEGRRDKEPVPEYVIKALVPDVDEKGKRLTDKEYAQKLIKAGFKKVAAPVRDLKRSVAGALHIDTAHLAQRYVLPPDYRSHFALEAKIKEHQTKGAFDNDVKAALGAEEFDRRTKMINDAFGDEEGGKYSGEAQKGRLSSRILSESVRPFAATSDVHEFGLDTKRAEFEKTKDAAKRTRATRRNRSIKAE